ncbi:MAG TPA: glycosyltransferase family 4 protein, partial [Bacteroidota bacterium]|nr:glycosyltransferase family 4 protein [Bacteroidota bacterium]
NILMGLRILQICPRIPYPLHDGGAIGVFNITKHVAQRGHTIRMVTFDKSESSPPRELTRWCSVRTVNAYTGHSIVKLISSQWRSIPYMQTKYRHEKFADAIREEVTLFKPDVVHVDHLVMAQYGLLVKTEFGIPIVLREHNLETKFLKRLAENDSSIMLRYFARRDVLKMASDEAKTCSLFDRVVMISREDESGLKELAPDAKTRVIPAGVTIPDLPSTMQGTQGHSILFLGALDWKPNVDALRWFCREVFPEILEQVPNADLLVVGKGKLGKAVDIDNPPVKLLGFVEDLTHVIANADVCIVPLLTGSGIRIKILELLAAGKAVVSTKIGAEGIEVESGKEILISDRPGDFARDVIELLRNPELRSRLGACGRTTMVQKYGWPAIAEAFETVYRDVCRG